MWWWQAEREGAAYIDEEGGGANQAQVEHRWNELDVGGGWWAQIKKINDNSKYRYDYKYTKLASQQHEGQQKPSGKIIAWKW